MYIVYHTFICESIDIPIEPVLLMRKDWTYILVLISGDRFSFCILGMGKVILVYNISTSLIHLNTYTNICALLRE